MSVETMLNHTYACHLGAGWFRLRKIGDKKSRDMVPLNAVLSVSSYFKHSFFKPFPSELITFLLKDVCYVHRLIDDRMEK